MSTVYLQEGWGHSGIPTTPFSRSPILAPPALPRRGSESHTTTTAPTPRFVQAQRAQHSSIGTFTFTVMLSLREADFDTFDAVHEVEELPEGDL